MMDFQRLSPFPLSPRDEQRFKLALHFKKIGLLVDLLLKLRKLDTKTEDKVGDISCI